MSAIAFAAKILKMMGEDAPNDMTQSDALQLCKDLKISLPTTLTKKKRKRTDNDITDAVIDFGFSEPRRQGDQSPVKLNLSGVTRALKHMDDKDLPNIGKKIKIMFSHTKKDPTKVTMERNKWTLKTLLNDIFKKYMSMGLTEKLQLNALTYNPAYKCFVPDVEFY